MSLHIEEKVEFNFPEKPNHTDPFAIADDIVEWTNQHVPYLPNNFYRPEMALTKGGVNCYGTAQAAAQLAESWDIPAGIILDKTHAHTVVKIGKAVLFLEANKQPDVRTMWEEAYFITLQEERQLNELYKTLLPDALESRDFGLYFSGPDQDDLHLPWQVRRTSTNQTVFDLTQHINPHIIVDTQRGAAMLCAIGDLQRYKKTKPARFIEKFPELIGLVPDFIDLSRPIKAQ
jgi:hypothetical protein